MRKKRPVTRDNKKIIITIILRGKHSIKELQKTAILGTAHILWKVLL